MPSWRSVIISSFPKAEPNPPAKIQLDVERYITQTKAMRKRQSERRRERRPRACPDRLMTKDRSDIMPMVCGDERHRETAQRKLWIGITMRIGSLQQRRLELGLAIGLYYRHSFPDGITIFEY